MHDQSLSNRAPRLVHKRDASLSAILEILNFGNHAPFKCHRWFNAPKMHLTNVTQLRSDLSVFDGLDYTMLQTSNLQQRLAKFPLTEKLGIRSPVLCSVDYNITQNGSVVEWKGARLEGVDIFQYAGTGCHSGDRRLQHIQTDSRRDYLITVPIAGVIEFNQAGRRESVAPGNFVVLSTSSPFKGMIKGTSPVIPFRAFHLRLSGDRFRRALPQVDRCCDQPLQLTKGMSTVLHALCDTLISEFANLSATEKTCLGRTLIETLANACVLSPDFQSTCTSLDTENSFRRIYHRALNYIVQQHSSSTLDTKEIARHCGISTRHLQAAFAHSEATVRATIRKVRLSYCRDRLRNESSGNSTIASIAFDAGFNDIPHFCRMYKTLYGITPSAEKTLARRDVGGQIPTAYYEQ